MGRSRTDDDREITNSQGANPVDDRNLGDGVRGGDRAAYVKHGRLCARVRLIVEGAHRALVIVVADPAEEEDLTAARGIGEGVEDFIRREWAILQRAQGNRRAEPETVERGPGRVSPVAVRQGGMRHSSCSCVALRELPRCPRGCLG